MYLKIMSINHFATKVIQYGELKILTSDFYKCEATKQPRDSISHLIAKITNKFFNSSSRCLIAKFTVTQIRKISVDSAVK